ncbi:hypothetical protein J2853_001760 [Streptosporangium lutulentum]|uniref:Uncharacterized protein n=1 Tax=Streptosporangium lutulentum TaxID=1461250 RepID=A0ABT9Q727_9ACTN|nr:hypothetical protein [Streptosporangium lutulentum]
MAASMPKTANSRPPSGAAPSPMTPEVKEFRALALVSKGPVPTTAGVYAWAAGRNSTPTMPSPNTAR